MKIFVKIYADKTITLDVEATSTVKQVKMQIQARERIPAEQQCLMFGGYELEDGRTLASQYVKNVSTLLLAYRMSPHTALCTSSYNEMCRRASVAEARATTAEEWWHRTEEARRMWAAEAIHLGWSQQPASSAASTSGAEGAPQLPSTDASASAIVAASTTVVDEQEPLTKRQHKRCRLRANQEASAAVAASTSGAEGVPQLPSTDASASAIVAASTTVVDEQEPLTKRQRKRHRMRANQEAKALLTMSTL